MGHVAFLEKEFEELFKVNYSRLFYCAYDITGNAEVSKDIVGDVFGEAWGQYVRLREEKADAYLYRSVRNRSIDYLRHKSIEQQYQQFFLQMELEWREENVEDLEEDIVYMRKILATFSSQTRLIFEQCYFKGLKYREVAEAMNLSEAAIHKHMVKAFAILRREFKKKAVKGN